jgi:hypothetical protein
VSDTSGPGTDAEAAAALLAARIGGAQAAMRAYAHRYDGLANVMRATAGGNAELLAGVYSDVAVLLRRLADGLGDDALTT